MRREGLSKTEGWKQVQTDEPSYTKLRAALRNGDERGARNIYRALVESNHTPEQIHQAMSLWARRPFTGSNGAEDLFRLSMDDPQRELYSQAQAERMEELLQFEEFYRQQAQ
jgi:hypothetical protein